MLESPLSRSMGTQCNAYGWDSPQRTQAANVLRHCSKSCTLLLQLPASLSEFQKNNKLKWLLTLLQVCEKLDQSPYWTLIECAGICYSGRYPNWNLDCARNNPVLCTAAAPKINVTGWEAQSCWTDNCRNGAPDVLRHKSWQLASQRAQWGWEAAT